MSDIESIRIVTKPNGTNDKVVQISIGETLGMGREGYINRVTTTVNRDGNTRNIDLAYKNLFANEIISYDRIFQMYTLAKNAGLPVPATFRSTENRRGILMTDLTHGGENIVLSINNLPMAQVRSLYNKNPEQMSNFSHADSLVASEKIQKLSKEYSEKAALVQLDIPTDAWFFIVRPDGNYNFMIADFGRVKGVTQNPNALIPLTTNKLREKNEKELGIFIAGIRLIQQYGLYPQKSMEGLREIEAIRRCEEFGEIY